MLRLNSPFSFFVLIFITIILYGVQHIYHSTWIYEDSTWLNANYTFTGNWFTLKDSFPSKDFAFFTFKALPVTPVVAHSVNLLIHVFNSIILAILIEDWFSCGFIVASLFLVNPLTIQAVAYVAGRSELLSLTALLIFLWFATASYANIFIRWIMIVLSVLMMLTTKPTVIIAAPLILILLYHINYHSTIFWVRGLNMNLFCACLLVLLFLAPNVTVQVHSTISKWDWFRVQTSASWKLIFESLTGQGLAIDHPWWIVSYTMSIISVICGVIVGIVVLIKKNSFTFGLGWFWVTMLPRLITPNYLGWIREHHAYVPLIGVCIAFGSLLGGFNDRQSIPREFGTKNC